VKLNDSQTKKLLEYAGQPQLKQLALNMALTRLKGLYKSSPTPDTISKCTAELNALFEKFAMIMGNDYAWIVSL
jgi:uncharacterized iron-regulated protein